MRPALSRSGKEIAMAAAKRVDLHGINDAIKAVQAALKRARRSATKEDRARLEKLLARLEGLRASTSEICPRAWAVWPEDVAVARMKGPAKPRAKKKR